MKGKKYFTVGYLFNLFPCSVTVTGAVKKSLFEYLVHCGTDEADKTMKTVRSKVVHGHAIDCFQFIKLQLHGKS